MAKQYVPACADTRCPPGKTPTSKPQAQQAAQTHSNNAHGGRGKVGIRKVS